MTTITEIERENKEALHVLLWVLRKGLRSAWIVAAWGTVTLNVFWFTNSVSRDACLRDGAALCAYKSKWNKDNWPHIPFMRTPPWDKPGFSLANDWSTTINK